MALTLRIPWTSRRTYVAATIDRHIEPLIGFRIRSDYLNSKTGALAQLSRRVYEVGIWSVFAAVLVYYDLPNNN